MHFLDVRTLQIAHPRFGGGFKKISGCDKLQLAKQLSFLEEIICHYIYNLTDCQIAFVKNVVQLTSFERTFLYFYFKPSYKSFPETGGQAVGQR